MSIAYSPHQRFHAYKGEKYIKPKKSVLFKKKLFESDFDFQDEREGLRLV